MIHAQLHATLHQGIGSVLPVALLGLILGVRHSTDADHIVALSTIVSKQRSVKSGTLIGCLWGVGHTITIFAVGSLMILVNVRIPTRLGLAMEFSVAVMLVVLGLLNLTGLTKRWTERFTPAHTHGTPHEHGMGSRFRLRNSIGQMGVYHWARPLAIGLVHGLAGSAAVALLVLSTIRSPLWAVGYLLIFGLGTIVGMMVMTTAVAVPLALSTRRFTRLNEHLAIASGLVSICFGAFLMYHLGFVGGLFTSHPYWQPQ